MDADGLVSWVQRQIVYVRDLPVLIPGRQPSPLVEFDSLLPSQRSRLEWCGMDGWLLREETVMATTPFAFVSWDADGREVAT